LSYAWKKRRRPYLVFSYSYGGESFEVRDSFSSSYCLFNVGDYVELYVDPEKPEKFYCPKETIYKIFFYLIFVVIGAIVLVIFIKSRD